MPNDSSPELPECPAALLVHLRDREEKRGNVSIKDRAEIWLRHGGDELDVSPPNFHHAIASWMGNAGLVARDKIDAVAAVLYCLGVTNSNNLFQKMNQGKLAPFGIGRNGRRNAKGHRKN